MRSTPHGDTKWMRKHDVSDEEPISKQHLFLASVSILASCSGLP